MNRASYQVEAGTSELLSISDIDLGVCGVGTGELGLSLC